MTNAYPSTCKRASYSMGKIDRVKGEEGKTMGGKIKGNTDDEHLPFYCIRASYSME